MSAQDLDSASASRAPAMVTLLRATGVDLRPGEGRVATLLFFGFFFSLVFQYAAKTVRQASFLDAYGAERLPWVYLLVPLVSYPGLLLYEALLRRYSPTRVLAMTCLGTSATLGFFWWLYSLPFDWVRFVFYLWVTVAIGLNLSLVWAVSGVVLDPRQAKRLFGFLGAGALIGGIAGGQVARLVSLSYGVRATLLAAAIALGVAAVCSYAAGSNETKRDKDPKTKRERASAHGVQEVRRSPLLRRLAGVLMLSMIAAQVIDLQFNWVVEQATTGLSDRAVFFGNFYSVMGVAAAIFQIFWTSRIHRSLGVGFALRVLPASLVTGTAILFLAATFWPSLLLLAGLALKVGENGIRYSLDQSTRELLFVPVPRETRMRAKAVIDVLLQRGAKGLAALLLLPVAFGWLTPVRAGWLNLAILALWLLMLPGLYREYVRAFRRRLHERESDGAMPIDFTDAATLEILVESLGSQDPRQVLHSLDLLASHGRGRLVPPLLLYHDDVDVRSRTLEILSKAGRSDALPLIERRLGDDHPDVRALAIQVLADLQHGEVDELMRPRLHDSDPAIRAAAIACLASSGAEVPAAANEALYDMLSDADPNPRIQGARCLGAIPEPLFREQLVQLLYDRDWRVVSEAIGSVRRRAQRDGWTPIYLPTLISLHGNRRLKQNVREALVALGKQVLPSLVHFLNDNDEQTWVRRALPNTIARLECDEAPSELLSNLAHQRDPFLRRKIIEALCSVREALLDSEPHQAVIEQIRIEVRRYFKRIADLSAVSQGRKAPRPTRLLEQLLESRAESHLGNIFGLLSLLYAPEPIWAAHRSITFQDRSTRAHALEFLDNTLEGELRRDVMAVLDERGVAEKLHDVGLRLGVRSVSSGEVLGRCLEGDAQDDADWSFFTSAALLAVHNAEDHDRMPQVERLVASENAFVAQTAGWVKGRMSGEIEVEI
ncbi:MAG: MFS transporter [Thermoanaerobaculia bacterium]